MQSILTPFEISDQMLIKSTLRELMRHAGAIYLTARQPNRLSVSARMVSFDATDIVIEANVDDARLQELMSANAPCLIANLGFVQVQFDLHNLRLTSASNRIALCGAVPNVVYRIQRREGVRVRPFASQPIVCHMRSAQGRSTGWSVLDLSVIGLALQVPALAIIPATDTIIEHAQLEYGSDTPIPVHLAVRRCWLADDAPESGRVLGCEFRYLDQNNERRLQLLITEIERASFRINQRIESH